MTDIAVHTAPVVVVDSPEEAKRRALGEVARARRRLERAKTSQTNARDELHRQMQAAYDVGALAEEIQPASGYSVTTTKALVYGDPS